MLPEDLDVVVHCAASAGGRDIRDLVRSNVEATARLAAAVAETDCRLWIQLSTVSIHGEAFDGVLDEASDIGDVSEYGETKRVAESLLQEGRGAFAVRCLRLPAVLSPGARRHWPARVLAAANRNEPISIFNQDMPFNNAVHIDDLTQFIVHLAKTEQTGFDAFPIASTEPITVAEAAQVLIDSAGSGSVVTVDSSPRPSFYVDDAYARSSYGYASRSTYAALRDYGRLARYARPGDDIGEKCPGPQ